MTQKQQNDIRIALEKVLADSYTLYLKTQNFHWNVTGPEFHTLHSLFEMQYVDLAQAIDAIAERIRMLGGRAPGSFTAFAAHATIREATGNESANDMTRQLAADQTQMISVLQSTLAIVGDDDAVTNGLLVDRIAVHEKNRWLLHNGDIDTV